MAAETLNQVYRATKELLQKQPDWAPIQGTDQIDVKMHAKRGWVRTLKSRC